MLADIDYLAPLRQVAEARGFSIVVDWPDSHGRHHWRAARNEWQAQGSGSTYVQALLRALCACEVHLDGL